MMTRPARTTFSVRDARVEFSKLIERVRKGEEIVIAEAGEPVARLVPYLLPMRAPRKPGLLKGRIRIARNFDDPLPADLFSAVESVR